VGRERVGRAKRAPIAEVPRGNAADVERAVAAATRAYADWRKVVPRERGKALLKIADSIQARTEEIARTIALETGNALRTQARGEANSTADIFRYFGGLASELKGETLPLGEHVLSYTRREPLGVVGAIIPWNAPVMLAALKIAPALCAGNTMVMKAAEDAPLGVKSPSIVYPDADQDWAVDGIIAAMRFTRQSQSCTAGSRLFLHEDIFDSFLGKLEKKTTALRIGDPLDEKTDIGTIINNKQFTKVCKYVEEGLRRSDARLVFGGLPPRTGPLSEGYYALPTVFADRSNDWRLAREEIFGPVLVAIRWSDEAEAIRMANDSHYGLAAYVWTHDIGAGLRTAHAIEAGWVQVNQGGGQVPGMSYGGFKQSGIGREFSLEGMLDSFTQRKSVTVNLAV
jgi:acyl-CoA reductase-like NAD-dependent aldehyde dehydrogenase